MSSHRSPSAHPRRGADRPSSGGVAASAQACALALLLAACGDEQRKPAAGPQAPLSAEQQQILRSLNELGTEDVAGRTHQYELRSECVLVVEERLHGKRKGETEVPLRGLSTKVIPYIDGTGFGLKAQAPGGPSSLDVFDSKSEAPAVKAGELLAQLSARCK